MCLSGALAAGGRLLALAWPPPLLGERDPPGVTAEPASRRVVIVCLSEAVSYRTHLVIRACHRALAQCGCGQGDGSASSALFQRSALPRSCPLCPQALFMLALVACAAAVSGERERSQGWLDAGAWQCT